MLRQVYKYALERSVDLPIGGKVLKIKEQDGEIMLWWDFPIIEPPQTEKIEFAVIGTGVLYEELEYATFIDTVFSGRFVWHVYQL